MPNQQQRRVWLGALSLSITVLIFGIGAYGVHRHHQHERKKQEQAAIERATTYQMQGQYQSCRAELGAIAPSSALYRQAQSIGGACQNSLDKAQLNRAKTAAQTGKFRDALLLLDSISLESAYAHEVQQLIYSYSTRLLSIAQEYYLSPSGQLNEALSVVSVITNDQTNPLYDTALSAKQNWQQEWSRNQEHAKLAQIAIDVDDVDVALTEVIQISDHPYWNQRSQVLIQTIEREQQRHEMLWIEARQAILQEDAERAMQLASQLPDVPKWAERKQDLFDASEVIYRKQAERFPSLRKIVLGVFLFVLEVVLLKASGKYNKDLA